MNKINENTKVTLTLKQLKTLVKEARREDPDSFYGSSYAHVEWYDHDGKLIDSENIPLVDPIDDNTWTGILKGDLLGISTFCPDRAKELRISLPGAVKSDYEED